MSTPDSSIARFPLAEFADALASQDATPGGGSAAAVAASLGASLGSMVVRLSLGRPAYEAHADLLRSSLEATEAARRRLMDLAEEDVRAYDRYTRARRLPREMSEQRAERAAAMADAIRSATEVPLTVIEECRALVGVLEPLAGRTNPNVASDLEVAVLLLDAATQGAAANVATNLRSLRDPAAAASIAAQVDDSSRSVHLAAERTRARIRALEGTAPHAGPA
jgi:formiminotetrahydrofolate cyclodeaminase